MPPITYLERQLEIMYHEYGAERIDEIWLRVKKKRQAATAEDETEDQAEVPPLVPTAGGGGAAAASEKENEAEKPSRPQKSTTAGSPLTKTTKKSPNKTVKKAVRIKRERQRAPTRSNVRSLDESTQRVLLEAIEDKELGKGLGTLKATNRGVPDLLTTIHGRKGSEGGEEIVGAMGSQLRKACDSKIRNWFKLPLDQYKKVCQHYNVVPLRIQNLYGVDPKAASVTNNPKAATKETGS